MVGHINTRNSSSLDGERAGTHARVNYNHKEVSEETQRSTKA